MDEAVRIEITGKIDGKIARSIRDIAKASLEADTAIDTLREAINSFTPGQQLRAAVNDYRELRNEINRVKQTQQTLVNANKTTAASFVTAANAATKYGQSVRQVEAANARASGSFGSLRGAISSVVGLMGGIFAIRGYVEAQDALTGLQNKLRALTPDVERQVYLQEQLFNIANRTRTGVASLTDGFVRYAKALNGASDQEVLRFTETLTKLLASAGRTAGEVNSVVVQLGQALTSGRLQGDEFRSLSENLPRDALQAIADVLGTNVESLKELASEGVITTDVLREAFGGLAAFADEQFARTIPTISSALEVLNNKFIEFTANSSAGANLLAQAIIWLGDQLHIIIPAVALFAAGWAAVGIVNITRDIINLTKSVWGLVAGITAANATLLLWVGVFALVGAAAVSLAYLIAQLTGQGEAFEEWLAGSIKQMQNWVGGVMGMISGTADATAAGGQFQSALTGVSQGMQGLTGVTNANTAAVNDNTKAVKKWSDETTAAVDKVAYSYDNLSRAQKDALKAGADRHYASLQAAGGSSGSFTAVGKGTNQTGSVTKLPAFARGGSFTVGGRPGIDRNVVPIRASRGERVDVLTPAQQRAERDKRSDGPPTFIFNINTPDADSFRKSRGQIASDTLAALL